MIHPWLEDAGHVPMKIIETSWPLVHWYINYMTSNSGFLCFKEKCRDFLVIVVEEKSFL